MKITINTGPNFKRLQKSLGKAPGEIVKALHTGLMDALTDAEGEVESAVGSGTFLKRRTGNLTKAIRSYPDGTDPLLGYVGVGSAEGVKSYAWLLGKEKKTITPKSGEFLAIPIADGLTAKGVPRYASPLDVPKSEGGFFFKKNDTLFFARRTGPGDFDLLFVLKESVDVEGSGVLPDTMQKQQKSMTRTIRKSVMSLIRKLGL